jgi:KaiC/GvpD/RAD55 family RecA-like ATPase
MIEFLYCLILCNESRRLHIMLNDYLLSLFRSFFRQNYGNSLIIKGKPGAGKTSFALELLNVVRDEVPVHYISTRASEDPLLLKFPWLQEISSGKRSRNRETERLSEASKVNLENLEKMIEEGRLANGSHGDIQTGLVMNVEELLPELEYLYSFVDKNLSRNPIIVIDSIEALSEKYDLDSSLLFSIIQKDLVEASGANVIVVMESEGENKLDYYSDGVVAMSYELPYNFLIRTVRIEKLRGVSIGSSPIYIYSLDEGRFHSFNRDKIIYPSTRITSPSTDVISQIEVPFGNNDFNSVLELNNGNIPIGSVIVLHRKGKSTSVDKYVNLLKNNLIKQTISEGRGVIDITSSNYESSRILSQCLDPEWMSHYITAEKSDRQSPYIINLGGKSMVEDFPAEVVDFYLSSSRKPNVYIFSTDFLEFVYGSTFYGDLATLINSLRSNGIIFIVADDDEFEKILHFGTYVIHMSDNYGYVTVNSTPSDLYLCNIENDQEGWPSIRLSIMV